MKNLILLSLILFCTLSFGQTKKKKIKKNAEAAIEIKIKQENQVTEEKTLKDRETVKVEVVSGLEVEDENVIFNASGIEIKPEYNGGTVAMNEFVVKNANFNTDSKALIKGKVIVGFVVEKNGSLTDVKVLRDLGNGTGKEVLRLVKLMPNWNPGMQNGKYVRYMITTTILVN